MRGLGGGSGDPGARREGGGAARPHAPGMQEAAMPRRARRGPGPKAGGGMGPGGLGMPPRLASRGWDRYERAAEAAASRIQVGRVRHGYDVVLYLP